MKKLVHCKKCRETIRENERIEIDIVNGLTHEKCGAFQKVKDAGTYKEIFKRHPHISIKYNL